jgi:hypothetical protein
MIFTTKEPIIRKGKHEGYKWVKRDIRAGTAVAFVGTTGANMYHCAFAVPPRRRNKKTTGFLICMDIAIK